MPHQNCPPGTVSMIPQQGGFHGRRPASVEPYRSRLRFIRSASGGSTSGEVVRGRFLLWSLYVCALCPVGVPPVRATSHEDGYFTGGSTMAKTTASKPPHYATQGNS